MTTHGTAWNLARLDQHNLNLAAIIAQQQQERQDIVLQSHREAGWTNARYLVPCPRWIYASNFPMPPHARDYFPSTPKLLG